MICSLIKAEDSDSCEELIAAQATRAERANQKSTSSTACFTRIHIVQDSGRYCIQLSPPRKLQRIDCTWRYSSSQTGQYMLFRRAPTCTCYSFPRLRRCTVCLATVAALVWSSNIQHSGSDHSTAPYRAALSDSSTLLAVEYQLFTPLLTLH